MSKSVAELVGAGALQDASGAAVDAAAVLGAKKYVALYFSAHWCPPCRGFTPRLVEWYKSTGAGTDCTWIFVSADKDEASFRSYYAEMGLPFAVPPAAKDAQRALSRWAGVQGIPTLVVAEAATGKIVTDEGREGVVESPDGFPWPKKSAWEILDAVAGPLVNAAGETKPASALRGAAHVALYFSAHWCPPCRAFTPKLAAWYKAVKARLGDAFELVFVSSDRSPADFKEYLAEMPWWAVPLEDKATKAALSAAFSVQGIPALHIIAADGTPLAGSMRAKVEADPAGAGFPYVPGAWDGIDEAADFINELPTLVMFTDKLTDAGAEAAAEAAFKDVAAEVFAAAGGKPDDAMRFALARDGDDMAENVRGFLRLDGDKDGAASVRVAVVDIQGQAKYVLPLGVPTADALRAFVRDVRAGSAPKLGLKDAVTA